MVNEVPTHIADLANTIAGQAEAIRDGRTSARPASAVKLMRHNVETLQAWLEQEQDACEHNRCLPLGTGRIQCLDCAEMIEG
jgi:hypothetical protein